MALEQVKESFANDLQAKPPMLILSEKWLRQ